MKGGGWQQARGGDGGGSSRRRELCRKRRGDGEDDDDDDDDDVDVDVAGEVGGMRMSLGCSFVYCSPAPLFIPQLRSNHPPPFYLISLQSVAVFGNSE